MSAMASHVDAAEERTKHFMLIIPTITHTRMGHGTMTWTQSSLCALTAIQTNIQKSKHQKQM